MRKDEELIFIGMDKNYNDKIRREVMEQIIDVVRKASRKYGKGKIYVEEKI